MAEKIVIPVALLGLGTVGGGVYELFKRQKDEFFPKTGTLPMITHILVRDKKKPRPGVDPSLLTDRWEDIIGDPQVKIIIEVTGGIEPARSRIIKALEAGKTVITANKDLMAEHGAEPVAPPQPSRPVRPPSRMTTSPGAGHSRRTLAAGAAAMTAPISMRLAA